jgi:hypothetical protein
MVHPAYMQPYAQQAAGAQQYGTGAMEIVGQFGPAAPAPPHPMGPHPGAPHPQVHLAHPYHPMYGWRGHGGPPVVFAGYPGGGVAYGGAPAVVERPLRDIREYPLGFFQSGIGVCTGAIDVISRPQIVFRGERLVVPSVTVAPNFSLIDIKVGNRSQLANSTSLPAQTFQENAVGVRLALDTATVAMDIALVVENITSDNQTFMAALIGTAAQ